jgi:hypothetical protein
MGTLECWEEPGQTRSWPPRPSTAEREKHIKGEGVQCCRVECYRECACVLVVNPILEAFSEAHLLLGVRRSTEKDSAVRPFLRFGSLPTLRPNNEGAAGQSSARGLWHGGTHRRG